MRRIFALLALTLAVGCATARFDQNSYNAAQTLKIEAHNLVGKAALKEPPPVSEITTLETKLQAQVAYETGKGKANWESAIQWKRLTNPEGLNLGRFLAQWRTGAPLSPVFVEEQQKQFDRTFDAILELEGAKIQ